MTFSWEESGEIAVATVENRAILVHSGSDSIEPQSPAIPPLGWKGAVHVENVPWNTNSYRHLAQDSGTILRSVEREKQRSNSTCTPQLTQQSRERGHTRVVLRSHLLPQQW